MHFFHFSTQPSSDLFLFTQEIKEQTSELGNNEREEGRHGQLGTNEKKDGTNSLAIASNNSM